MAGKETKGSRRKSRRPRPLKIAALVVSAIQDLRETKGSTPKKITGYISYASSIPEKRVKRQVGAVRPEFSVLSVDREILNYCVIVTVC